MATYEVTVQRVTFNDTVFANWVPSPTGSGTVASRYEFEAGDIIKFKKPSTTDVITVTPSSGFLNTGTTSFTLTTTFTQRTVQSTAANYTLTYSIFYEGGGGEFP